MTQKLIINEALKNLLPPLSSEEYAGLEESILKDGCLAPLVLWNDIIVDGHHRYEICTKHQIPYAIKNIELENLDDAKLWAGRHQENRRNLTGYHRGELSLKLKEVYAARAKERQRAAGGDKSKMNPEALPPKSAEALEAKETRKELAKIAGIAPSTLGQIEYIAEHADEETKEKLRRGEKGTSINKEYKQLRAEEKATSEPSSDNPESSPESESAPSAEYIENPSESEPDYSDEVYPPLSQPIPEKDSQFVQTVKLQNIPLNDPERLIACLFDLFARPYREKLVLNLVLKMKSKDGMKTAQRIITKLNKIVAIEVSN